MTGVDWTVTVIINIPRNNKYTATDSLSTVEALNELRIEATKALSGVGNQDRCPLSSFLSTAG